MKPAQKRLLAIIFPLFFLFYLFRLRSVPVYQIPENTKFIVRGKITQQPYLKGSYQIIYLGPIMIKTDRFPGYFYGQKVEVVGRFKKRVINRFQTQYFANFPTIQVIDQEVNETRKISLNAILFKTRGQFEKTIGELIPEPQLSLLLGILFGGKRQMPYKFWQDLQKTGTLHIVVASGQNVTMVARFLIGLLVWVVNRRKALLIAIVGVILYVFMVGAEAPVVRAGIMAVLAYFAQMLGREQEGTIALFSAAAVMLLISPLLIFDIGFQLSFAATAGILWFYPLFKKKKFFSLRILGEGLATTLSAQLGVMPLLLTNFGQISFLSPLINGLVLWVVPIIMVLGLVVVFLGLIIKPFAWVLSWFVWLLLTYFVKVIELASNLPWASFQLGKLSGWWTIGYYLVLGIWWRGRDERD